MSSIRGLLPILQTAIGPVILISGVGLLLLSMTNRLSRVIDRARVLLALIASLIVFITDINRSLTALTLELFGQRQEDGKPDAAAGGPPAN